MLDFMAAYEATILSRCALISFPVLAVATLLRETLLRRSVFLKGAVWLLFLPVLFMGKLRLYYEVRVVSIPFIVCQELSVRFPLFRWGILIVTLALLGRLLYRRKKERSLVWLTTKTSIAGENVYLTDVAVSPFAMGLFRPKIILPRHFLSELSAEELRTIVLHEKTHIRLFHLWIFFAWDVLSTLLWMNPLLFMAAESLHGDMEEICDRVVLQHSEKGISFYGALLLKTAGLLGNTSRSVAAGFLGNNAMKSRKRRFERIAYYHPYRKKPLVISMAGVTALLCALLVIVETWSFPKYEILPDITITDEEGRILADGVEAESSGAVTRQADGFLVDAEKLRTVIPADYPEDAYVYFYYDFCMKLPGIGGGGDCAWGEALPQSGMVQTEAGEDPIRNRIAVLWMKLM